MVLVTQQTIIIFFKQLGDSPDNSKNGVITYSEGIAQGYTYLNFKSLQTTLNANTNASSSGYTGFGQNSNFTVVNLGTNGMKFEGLGQEEGYSYASTPFITSQIFEHLSKWRCKRIIYSIH